jgi:hypothetical protein
MIERQNEEEMQSLHGKIKALRSVRGILMINKRLKLKWQVTIDILDDSSRQNDGVSPFHISELCDETYS